MEPFDETNLGVLLPARLIPDDAHVTKVRGEKRYRLLHRVRVFMADGKRHEIASDDGARFLHNGRGEFNAVSGDTILVWHVGAEELHDFLHGVLNVSEPDGFEGFEADE
jgi:hypothetical protein